MSSSPNPSPAAEEDGVAPSKASAHSRVTGALRLMLSVWLIASAVGTLLDPERAASEQGLPMPTLLPLAGLYFALGIFLLTGFMSRVGGLILLGLGAWETLSFGVALMPLALFVVGLYLMLRGGGAWAMDIYVQKVQDRARRKAAALNSPESS